MSDAHISLLRDNIKIMNDLVGFDVVMVCCSSAKQAQFWQRRLENGRGSVLPENCVVLAVEEDWPGGAGNALGTLYAFQKAAIVAQELYSLDILAELMSNKISIGLYHTAGKGTRLAPLPGSENNNKPGVKLPTTIIIEDKRVPMTILEAVIKQTGCYAKSRMGRLSVFWGDQVFIPTAPVEYTVTHHIDILCSLGPMPTEEIWKEKGMDKYGLIAVNNEKNAAQVEKVSHSTAVQLLTSLGEINSVGVSLGSFSLSYLILNTLLNEFQIELSNKIGKLDSDPHWWMPMTLEKPSYMKLMEQKGIQHEISNKHYDRIDNMMKDFYLKEKKNKNELKLFGAVDVGQNVCWWDYGQLKLYQYNNLMMTENTPEAGLMRMFMGFPEDSRQLHSEVVGTVVDERSCLSSCQLGRDSDTESGNQGFVRNSVLSNVRCKYIEAEGCVLINVTAERIIARPGSIIYNYVEQNNNQHCTGKRTVNGEVIVRTAEDQESKGVRTKGNGEVRTEDGEVIASVFGEDTSQNVLHSHISTDGGKVWDERVHNNSVSFSENYDLNTSACPSRLQSLIAEAHDQAWKIL